MAIVSLLAGGLIGFFSALVSLIVLNASWLTALAIWSGMGIVVAALIGIIALLLKKPREIRVLAQHARIFSS